MNNLRLILGSPGTGKTSSLLRIVAEHLAAGTPPSRIAFVTFTKAAANEAKERAAAQFTLDPRTDLPWFRTIHSLTYARLGVTREEMMERRDWVEFGTVVREKLTGYYDATEGFASTRTTGDQLLRVTDLASTCLLSLEEAHARTDDAVDWWRLKRFADALTAYKSDTGKMDFTDLLHKYVTEGQPLDIDVAIVDEAQDLTAAQWSVVRFAFSKANLIYVGGDDDQAIYSWAGADVRQFLTLSTTPEVLTQSHRLPQAIHRFSQRIAEKISRRYLKPFHATERRGVVQWHNTPESVDLSAGTWFLIARNTYSLAALEAHVRDLGHNYMRRSGPAVNPEDVRAMQLWERLRNGKVPDMSAKEVALMSVALDRPKPQTRELSRYTMDCFGDVPKQSMWFDALTGIPRERRDYYLSCLRRGEKLTVSPRIRLETIHGVKGAQADHVLLMTDVSEATLRSFRSDPDSEHRVFYVGVTRALHSLHLVSPQTDRSYPMS